MEFFSRPPNGAPWCPTCGSVVLQPSAPKPWPWRINHKTDLLAYLSGLEAETIEWMLAFYVASDLRLIAVEPPVRGNRDSVHVDTGKLICRARQLEAGGMILVHNHPAMTPTPSAQDIEFTQRLRKISAELDVPLLDHFILAGKELIRIGAWI